MDWFDLLVETPADWIGTLLGILIHMAFMLGSAAAAIYAGVLVYQSVQTAIVRHVAAGLVGLYIGVVLISAESHMAAGIFQAMKSTDLD